MPLALGAAGLRLVPASRGDGPRRVVLAPHRAVYDLKLRATRSGKSPSQAVRGRILYDFSGNACEGYALQFRQVSELDTGEGKVARATCARRPGRMAPARPSGSIRRTIVNDEQVDAVDGNAERGRAMPSPCR